MSSLAGGLVRSATGGLVRSIARGLVRSVARGLVRSVARGLVRSVAIGLVSSVARVLVRSVALRTRALLQVQLVGHRAGRGAQESATAPCLAPRGEIKKSAKKNPKKI